jgi:hypothetical protein
MTAQSTYTLIYTASGDGTTTNAFTFNSIPQNYTDLLVVINAKVVGGTTNYYGLSLNGVRSGYSYTRLDGSGSSASSIRSTGLNQLFLSAVNALPIGSNYFCSSIVHILNYSNSNTIKSILNRTAFDQNGSGNSTIQMGLLNGSTAAVTSLTIELDVSNTFFTTDTKISLYGIQAA